MTQSSTAPPKDQRLTMSYEAWLTWSSGTGRSEWIDGEVIVFMPPTVLHQRIVGFLFTLLSLYARARGLGEVLGAPVEMRLSPQSSREPDILLVATRHLDRLTPQRLMGPADLVVEVLSDDSVIRDRVDKVAEYAEAGVPEYWVFDPRPGQQREDFYRRSPAGVYEPIVPDADGRYHAASLPGYWLRPAWLRQDPLPSPLDCLIETAPDAITSLRPVAGAENDPGQA